MASSIQITPIFAEALQVDEIRLELLNELRKQGRLSAAELRKCVRTWRDKPKFKDPAPSLKGGNASVTVAPSGSEDAVNHWNWTDEGTRAHIIEAKRAPMLRFRGGWKAKTSPGVIGSGQSKSSGGWVSKKRVHHKGTKARKFTETVGKLRSREFDEAMQKAVMRGAQKAYKKP